MGTCAERTVSGVEAILTGKVSSDPDDHRALVERISVELSGMSKQLH